MLTGFPELDEIIAKDEWVEFYSEDLDLLEEFYSRVIALSSHPFVKVLVVAERGGLDPWKVKSYQRAFGVNGRVLVRRAFKPEDVGPSVEAMGAGDLVVINPYGFFRLYTHIVGAMRRRGGRTFVFSPFDREKRGSVFGLHSAHSVIEVTRGSRGVRFRVVKSPDHGEVELSYPIQSLFGRESVGLEAWL
ncbi:MAG: hypothetical protein ACP5HQ_03035 [Thermoprotei archaeon]